MNGFIQVQMNMQDGSSLQVWQKIVDGEVVDYVDGAGNSVTVPIIREERCLTGQLMTAPQ